MGRNWNEGDTFLLVTGASRGLGQAFAIAMAGYLGSRSIIYLTGRTESDLTQSRNAILKKNERLQVEYFIIDHANAKRETYVNMLQGIAPSQFGSAIIIHNAGSIGRQGKMVRDYGDKEELNDYFVYCTTLDVTCV